MLQLSAGKADYQAAVAALAMGIAPKIKLVLAQVGFETVAYLRSLTDEMRPPIGSYYVGPSEGYYSPEEGEVRGQGPKRFVAGKGRRGREGRWRRAHPGHWADVTGILANSYAHSVERIPDGWRLVLSNTAEYAIHLEARDGFFVLSGVTEPGGPVYEAIRAVAAVIAPEWTVTVEARGVKRMELQGPAPKGSRRAPRGGI